MRSETQTKAQARLSRIEGQIRGISRMVSEDKYCIDIVRQIQAARSALRGLEKFVIGDHLNTCVDTALKSDDVNERRAKVEELVDILSGARK